ncbi:MAG: 3-oxoacyl-[acyl-carrier-protein] reductase [Parachlamydiaceae bacterium]|nr:3-oxoacyl-[acyl-carrier-protein] reductase [Parachlamydiaceae bacterium]
MSHLLQDQVAVVTGGNAGIGKAIALQFAASGAKVAIFGTNAERGAAVVKEIEQANGPNRAQFFSVNVANTAEVEKAIKQVTDTIGQIDILVNNAGITRDQLLMKMSEEDWDTVLNVNVKSCYNTCKAVVRNMMKARKGTIINMSSVVGLSGNAGQTNYAASKAAIIGFTKALAKELSGRSIRVNCICPGFIATAMTEGLTDTQKESILASIPLGKMGSPADIAFAALFLASPLSNYVTGQSLVVDGGMEI